MPTSSASWCCSSSSSFSTISPHISCGTVDLTASQIWPNWTFNHQQYRGCQSPESISDCSRPAATMPVCTSTLVSESTRVS